MLEIRIPRLGDWTPSDSGPWVTLWNGDVPHVIPNFGPKHQVSVRCWCHPVLDEDYSDAAVSHNVAH